MIPYLNLYNKSSNWSGPILMKKHDFRFITYHLQFLHLALFVMSSLFTKTLKNNSVLLFFTFDWAYARKLVDEPSESRRIEYNRTNPNMLLNNMLCRWRSFGLFIPIDNEGDEFTCNPALFSPKIRFYNFIICNIRSFSDCSYKIVMRYILFNLTKFKINDYDYSFKAQDVAMQCCKNKMTVTGGKRSKTWA